VDRPETQRSEGRLDELREEAAARGSVAGGGVRAVGGPLPPRAGELPGYYGRPVLKPPVWTWEIPAYFFVGGLAGASAVLAWAARLGGAGTSEEALVRAALWLALAGALMSAALLISDLGRPRRFLFMLRVFKWRSPMSVGVWTLNGFGAFVTLGVAGAELRAASVAGGLADLLLTVGCWGGALLGAVVATYTGVLVGVTAVPAWNRHHALLPVHFGVAGLGSAAAVLQLTGFRLPALWALGVLTAAVETGVGLTVELSRHGAADRALRQGPASNLLRGSGLLAGPISLLLYLTGHLGWAGLAFLVGALVSRYGWLQAGRASALDPAAVLSTERR
jgi:hypothetical protein